MAVGAQQGQVAQSRVRGRRGVQGQDVVALDEARASLAVGLLKCEAAGFAGQRPVSLEHSLQLPLPEGTVALVDDVAPDQQSSFRDAFVLVLHGCGQAGEAIVLRARADGLSDLMHAGGVGQELGDDPPGGGAASGGCAGVTGPVGRDVGCLASHAVRIAEMVEAPLRGMQGQRSQES